MITLKGIGASPGVGIGSVYIRKLEAPRIEQRLVGDVQAELGRFERACGEAAGELRSLYAQASVKVGDKEAAIFSIHEMMLTDPDFAEAVRDDIQVNRHCAEYAVMKTGQALADGFTGLDDSNIGARAADALDITQRVIRLLTGEGGKGLSLPDTPCVVVTEDLLPSETIQMDLDKVRAFCTRLGSHASHAAILARTLGIPAVLGLGDQYDTICSGMCVIIDGEGIVILNPDEDTLVHYRRKAAEDAARRIGLFRVKGLESVTLDGTRIEICASIGTLSDLSSVLENDADGIGLFRSEFLFMESDDYPTEDEQMRAYGQTLALMAGKRVVIRTFDIGADKSAPYMKLKPEVNPAMGFRAIRVSLARKDMLKTQLRALLRASVSGRLAVMFPMISGLPELMAVKGLWDVCREELRREGVPFREDMEVGVMIEVPSAAILSDELAREVDFFSIGTNDLTQFVLAADRMNGDLAGLYDQAHPAVLRLMRLTAQNAKKNGIWCGVCGESAGDLALTQAFIDMGITELSVPPGEVLALREKVRSLKKTGAC